MQSDKAPNSWGRKFVVSNVAGLEWKMTTITAGNTALELAVAMDVVRRDRSLADLKWGDTVPMRSECNDWCAPLSHPLSLRSRRVSHGRF